MFIDVLECRPDGTQELVRREVPDDWFEHDPPSEPPNTLELLEAIKIWNGDADDELDNIIGGGA